MPVTVAVYVLDVCPLIGEPLLSHCQLVPPTTVSSWLRLAQCTIGPAGVTAAVGTALTVTTSPVDVAGPQPSLVVTLNVPEEFTVIEREVALLDQRYELATELVSVTLPP